MCATKEHAIKHLQMTIDQYAKAYALECIGEDRKRQFPLAEKILDRIYDCEVAAYNQAKQEIRDRINNS